ncbi:hypothetical protein AXG93_242s1040 [Marchantia polymorpha subsp. ruderalis]|uniref:Major facilitator superfamily (MFS) profile domain-containing protein n=2 Tax=Marchantia polymorpha TaxID=3197 RepID=A0A176VND5_MARPO|nr:hypothetical protein AXG93_242s1040 [Marchantia polymorpha subsp. ruderalis]
MDSDNAGNGLLSSSSSRSCGSERDCGSDDGYSSNIQSKEYLFVDDILERYVGEFGRAQFWHFVMVSLAWTLEGLITMATIFADRVPEWQCVPQISSNVTQLCTPAAKLCDLDPSLWEWAAGSGASTVAEWNLVCGNEYKVGLAGALFFAGGLLGDGLYGNLSDSMLGRKGALALACMMTSIMALLTSVAPNYWVYIVLRFLTGINASGIGLCCFVLGTELVGPKRRDSVGMSAFYFFSLGIMILPVFGFLSASSWRTLYFSIAIPGLVYCTLVLPFMSESPRWFLVKGRVGDAMKILRAFAEKNGNSIPPTAYLTADKNDSQAEDDLAEEEDRAAEAEYFASNKEYSKTDPLLGYQDDPSIAIGIYDCKPQRMLSSEYVGTIFDVFRYGETRCRMLLMVCIWFFIGVAYFGISLNVVNLDFNVYLGVFLNGLIEIPAFALTALMLNKLGKRFMLIFALCISGVCCLLGSLLFVNMPGGAVMNVDMNPAHVNSTSLHAFSGMEPWHHLEGASLSNHLGLKTAAGTDVMAVLRLLCGMAGIFGASAAYNLVYIYTLELFPTVVRNAALGLASQFSSIGTVVAPLVVVLGRYNPAVPFLIFGVFSLFGAAMGSRLPDHRNEALFETLEGMEEAENARKLVDVKGV